MSNTMISLPSRVNELRISFQNVGAGLWDTWGNGDRAGFILGALDTEAVRYDDSFSYDVFFKAYHTSEHSSVHLAELNYSQIMRVCDIAEKYAKNWIFT